MRSLPRAFRSTNRRRSSACLITFASVAIATSLELSAHAAFPPSAEGSHVAVTTDHPQATQAAMNVIQAGGNAFDGAIAAALVLGVVNPVASGIGGGGFAVYYSARDKKVSSLDFREVAPAALNTEDTLARKLAGASVGVPGEPAGLEWLHKRFGSRALRDLAAPAASIASRGFPLSKYMEGALVRGREKAMASPELQRLFFRNGESFTYRTLVRNEPLARTLLRFGAEGATPFYRGDIALKIVRATQQAGGKLSLADMTSYKVVEREPLARRIEGKTFYTMPAPSAGGLMLLESVTMFGASDASPLHAMGFNSSEYLHTVAEMMRGALADRVRIAGDPTFETGVMAAYDRALDPKQLAARRASIRPTTTHAAPEFRLREGGTSHLIVADGFDNVVSMTTTINDAFGARFVAEDTGILLNDQLNDFTAPADVVRFGVTQSPNRPRPKARPTSSMTPVIVMENGAPLMAAGGSGGLRIATEVTQVMLCRLIFNFDPSHCTTALRAHVTGSTDELWIEQDVAADVIAGLQARGEKVHTEPFATASAQLIAWERSPRGTKIVASTDTRKMGLAAAE